MNGLMDMYGFLVFTIMYGGRIITEGGSGILL